MLNYLNQHSSVIKSPTNLKQLADWLKVLSEEKRLLIFNLLMEGIQCNCEIGEKLNMAPNLISHHIGILRKAGLVNIERDALDNRWIYYSINLEAIMQLNKAFGDFFDPHRIQPRNPTCGPQYFTNKKR